MEQNKSSGNIKAIDKTTVHRICSGQVVLNLATAVKELIENSLDAGATVIDVKLKEYGSEMIEVVDNGVGVEASNFEGLTLKHHTSKLRDFSDLIGVETFGFRGEALSSLCALSELSIVTRHEKASCGTALFFDRNGHITDQKQHARQVGTTVTVLNLFGSLPVRQKEFHKNLKREFNKMTQLLSAYCLVSTGVKITCVNQTKSNSRTTFLSTQGCKTVKENISCLFGAKQLSSLLEIKQRLPSSEILADLHVSEEDCNSFTLEGYISSCAHGSGRGSSDRQFYFINSRPCEPAKIMKQVNEVYHQFNLHQYPFVFLNINVSKGAVDVNVTPDKRKIFLTEEKLLLAIIKASILDLYEKIPSTFTYNNVSLFSNKKLINSENNDKPNFNKFDAWRHKNDGKRKNDVEIDEKVPKKQIKIETQNNGLLEHFGIQKSIKKYDEDIGPKVVENESASRADNKEGKQVFKINEDVIEVSLHGSSNSKNIHQNPSQLNINEKDALIENIFLNDNSAKPFVSEDNEVKLEKMNVDEITKVESTTDNESTEEVLFVQLVEKEQGSFQQENNITESIPDETVHNLIPIEYDAFEERRFRSVVVPVDFTTIENSLKKRMSKSDSSVDKTTVRFRAVIDPSKNQQAETELNKEISKDMFEKMEIIGQFNLGFIITKLDTDLFIIDQHATDEKYNFETLQQTTVISNQKLVSPQVLELTAANECVVMENINIFNKNGFEFLIDENAPPTKRVSLTAVPMSKNWVFGKDDIDELIFMLQDSPGANCRPSRVRAMFASRACRKSVMIGTALEERVMRRLVNNMGTIEQPWNCPHGRPTMRHLVNLDLIRSNLS